MELEDLLTRMDPDKLFPLLITGMMVIAGSIIAIVAIVARGIQSHRDRSLSAQLVREMLNRNMSTSEISDILTIWNTVSTKTVEEVITRHAREPQAMPSKPPKPVMS